MHKARSNRLLKVPVALLTVLFVAATAGSLWHNHDHSSEFRCQTCHLGDQAVEAPLVTQRSPAPELVEALSASKDPLVRPGPVSRRTPSRAPPAT